MDAQLGARAAKEFFGGRAPQIEQRLNEAAVDPLGAARASIISGTR